MTPSARLLEFDPGLGDGLDESVVADARKHLILPTISLETGIWTLDDLSRTRGVHGEVRGFLVLRGAVAIDLAIAKQVCTRLITPTELVLLDGWEDDSIPVRAGWTALEPSTLALFDDRLPVIGRRWPDLMTAILKRAAEQVRHALLQQAISQLPRVEDRLLALMWSIADRQGRVGHDGIHLRLPATHATLAQMIGARRPTVSLGLRTLAERGVLTHRGDGDWILAADSHRLFQSPDVRPSVAKDS